MSCSSSSSGGSSSSGSSSSSSVLDLIQWSVKQKVRFSGIRPSIVDGVRGVWATGPVAAGETLIAVPLSAALTVTTGSKAACPFPAYVTLGTWEQLPWCEGGWEMGGRRLGFEGGVG